MITKELLRKSLFTFSIILGIFLSAISVSAQTDTDFPGTILSADAAAGKLAVKKEGSGTRFTFVVNEKTQFIGGPKSLGDLKKGDNVTVTYSVVGGQYIAQKVAAKGK
jgi:hypothetical protein